MNDQPPRKKLLLFDIDGTILVTHGIGRRAVDHSLSEVLGRPISSKGVAFSGKTDPQILREVLVRNGLADETLNGRFEDAVEAYRRTITSLLPSADVEVLPGIPELLRTLSARPDVQLALLTGNIESVAYLKLAAAGLDAYFSFGAFGSDNEDRYQLPPIAVARARDATGISFTGRDVIIIGDTEHDIGCGRCIDATSVAICTGKFDRDALSAHAPHVLFEDLSCSETFIRTVLS